MRYRRICKSSFVKEADEVYDRSRIKKDKSNPNIENVGASNFYHKKNVKVNPTARPI